MAAGERKFKVTEITFKFPLNTNIVRVEFSWGIEEADGQVRERRGNTADITLEELQGITTGPQRQTLQEVKAAIQTFVKSKVSEIAFAVEE